MNGGYVMIDMSGVDLSDPGTKNGLYERVKSAVSADKPIMLYGVKNGSQNFTPIPAFGGVESTTSVFLSFFPVTIHISNEDVITI